jgi:hypothetical protein
MVSGRRMAAVFTLPRGGGLSETHLNRQTQLHRVRILHSADITRISISLKAEPLGIFLVRT